MMNRVRQQLFRIRESLGKHCSRLGWSHSGPAFIGKAEISNDAAVQNKILNDFRQKYLKNRVLGVGPSRAKFDSGAVNA
jgi:hypothetical protein